MKNSLKRVKVLHQLQLCCVHVMYLLLSIHKTQLWIIYTNTHNPLFFHSQANEMYFFNQAMYFLIFFMYLKPWQNLTLSCIVIITVDSYLKAVFFCVLVSKLYISHYSGR